MQEAIHNPVFHKYAPGRGSYAFLDAVVAYFDKRFGDAIHDDAVRGVDVATAAKQVECGYGEK